MDNSILNWSLKLYRTSTLEVRASWLLGVWMLFDAVNFAHQGLWLLLPFAILVPLLSMYIHAIAHVTMARLVGGSADSTVLSMINDQTDLQIPLTPGKQLAVGAAGPLISLVLWLSAFALFHVATTPGTFAANLTSYVSNTNCFITLVNLLACAFADGARIWRAILWPLFGLGRAIRWTVMLSYVCSVLITVYGIYATNYLLFFCGLMSIITTVVEHKSIKLGFDPIFNIEFDSIHESRSQSWFGRWQQRRRVRALERRSQEVSAEQDIVDKLLEKVSIQGLPALTEQERATLNRISKKQKQREKTEI
jgi:hypothetical protein